MKNNKFLLWLLFFMVIMSVFQNFGKSQDTDLSLNEVGIATDKNEYKEGKEIRVTVQNNTLETISVNDCGEIPLDILRYENGEWENISQAYDACETMGEEPLTIASGEKETFSYRDWSYRLLTENGRYRIDVSIEESEETQTYSSNEFTIKPKGLIGRLWTIGVYQPILNTLVFLIEKMPGHSLGWALIALTLIIRTLLLIPSQRAMRSQRKMQDIQPKLEELKKKYKDNQEKLAIETMKLWKNNKVNPFGSCLLLLVQFPILIALYYVVQGGLHPDKVGLLYESIAANFSFDLIQTQFLGLNLLEINFFVLPLIVGGLQYIQMSLAMSRAKKKKEEKKTSAKEVAKKIESERDFQSEMQMATNMMKYVMPVMIAFFTASLPAGVGLYWGTSTTYGIFQQLVVNKEGTKLKDSDEPIVRVINKES